MTQSFSDYAVVIGVNEYKDPPGPLAGAANDARAFIDWVQNTTSDGDVDSTRTLKQLSSLGITDLVNLLDELTSQLREVGHKGRRLYIFVAGHGSGRRHKSAFLFASEHSVSIPVCWDIGDIAAQLESIFDEVVLFVDCCRTYMADAQPFPINLRLPYPESTRRHFHCFSCRLHEVTIEQDAEGGSRGVFSQNLLRVLEGKIAEAVDYQGNVTAYSLTHYLSKETSPAPDYHPSNPDSLREIVLARNLPTLSRFLEIRFTSPPSSFGVLHGTTLNELLWTSTRTGDLTYRLERVEQCIVVITVPKVADVNSARTTHFVKPHESTTVVEVEP